MRQTCLQESSSAPTCLQVVPLRSLNRDPSKQIVSASLPGVDGPQAADQIECECYP